MATSTAGCSGVRSRIRSANPEKFAPWDMAKRVCLYPSVFETVQTEAVQTSNGSSTLIMMHFLAYVRGAAGIGLLPPVKSDDASTMPSTDAWGLSHVTSSTSGDGSSQPRLNRPRRTLHQRPAAILPQSSFIVNVKPQQ
eukprot:SAG11_NODE_569_length_8458_cov_5.574231_2_plen_139_part_00